jgi:K+ transporter
MAGISHTPGERADTPGWWARHWANPSFSGSLIAVASVLVVMALGLYIGAEALHLDLGHLGLGSLLGR